jgi:hypothetical protein
MAALDTSAATALSSKWSCTGANVSTTTYAGSTCAGEVIGTTSFNLHRASPCEHQYPIGSALANYDNIGYTWDESTIENFIRRAPFMAAGTKPGQLTRTFLPCLSFENRWQAMQMMRCW